MIDGNDEAATLAAVQLQEEERRTLHAELDKFIEKRYFFERFRGASRAVFKPLAAQKGSAIFNRIFLDTQQEAIELAARIIGKTLLAEIQAVDPTAPGSGDGLRRAFDPRGWPAPLGWSTG